MLEDAVGADRSEVTPTTRGKTVGATQAWPRPLPKWPLAADLATPTQGNSLALAASEIAR
jgi:hypothetical protein